MTQPTALPHLNGLEAAERIAAIDPGVRVVLYTNNAEGEVHAVPVLVHASPGNGAASDALNFPVCTRA